MPVQRLVIVDRDGVINADSAQSIRRLADWQPLDGSIETLARLSRAHWTVAVATNQSGIGRGYLSSAALAEIHAALHMAVRTAGGEVSTIAVCPHRPSDHCTCRKPRRGLIDRIVACTGLTAMGAPFIGDSLRDMQAALTAGCTPVLVRTGNGTDCEAAARALGVALVFDDLREAGQWLLNS